MDILAEAQRRAFSLWLRTGRLRGALAQGAREFEFQPLARSGRRALHFRGVRGSGISAVETAGQRRGGRHRPAFRPRRRRPEPFARRLKSGGGKRPHGRGGGRRIRNQLRRIRRRRGCIHAGGGASRGAGTSRKPISRRPEPGKPPVRRTPQPAPQAGRQPATRIGERGEGLGKGRAEWVHLFHRHTRTGPEVRGEVSVNEGQLRSRTAQARAERPRPANKR